MQTPHALADVGADAVAKAGASTPSTANPSTTATPSTSMPDGPWAGPPLDPAREQALTDLMAQLSQPEARQIMSNLLDDYDKAPVSTAVPAARAIIGDKNAPVVIVDWTDPLCPHCAELHEGLDSIRRAAPPGTVAIEPHFFPLDAACNASVQRKGDTGEIRCTATKALLCLEDKPDTLALAQKLIFDNQASLSTVDKVWEVLAPIADKAKLQSCFQSPETEKKLEADIDAANKNHLEGTPLVLLNGKEVKPFAPVLFTLVLTGGKTHAEALKVLPPPKAMPPPQ
jgi:serine/threonine-protein kinase